NVAAWVDEHVARGESFEAPEFGTLGYLTGRRMIDPSGLINATNDFPRTRSLPSFLSFTASYRPGIALVANAPAGLRLEARSSDRIVEVCRWKSPWATLLVRGPSALADPSRYGTLRAEAGLPP